MKDYLIVVEAFGISTKSLINERIIGVTEEYANGVVKGLNFAYPKNEVSKEEIKTEE